MAKSKCIVCGAELDRTTAYKVEIVGPKTGKITYKYCCSQVEYEAEEARKKKAAEDKDRVYRLICDIMGVNEILNTALWKEKLEWNKAFSDEFIAKYLAEKKDYLSSAIARLSGNEYAKIRYISTVLKNSLRDFKPRKVVADTPKIVVEETIYNTPTQSTNKRRSLADIEEMF